MRDLDKILKQGEDQNYPYPGNSSDDMMMLCNVISPLRFVLVDIAESLSLIAERLKTK